jgi:hypothetical protein
VEEKYELLSAVLKQLQAKGVLDGLVIAGSWCQYYYRVVFDNAPEIPLLRTLDIDFLVPNPSKFKTNVDVSQLLNQLGFDSDFDYHTGLVKYVHPDLEIQFSGIGTGQRCALRDKAVEHQCRKLDLHENAPGS